MTNLVALGSQTAKQWFQNEYDVMNLFNNWKQSTIAQSWLKVMGYDLNKIDYVKAIKIAWSHKADIQVQVKVIIKLKDEIDIQNISIKLVSNKKGFNQVDKRWLSHYAELWKIPKDVLVLLQYFCGEIKPYKNWTKDVRRMFMTEMTKEESDKIINFLNKHKMTIVSDILKGRWEFSAEWMLVVRKTATYDRILKSINEVMNFYWNGAIEISPKWSIKIGRITMQRKWGDGWRSSANMLQFKIDPSELFTIN